MAWASGTWCNFPVVFFFIIFSNNITWENERCSLFCAYKETGFNMILNADQMEEKCQI